MIQDKMIGTNVVHTLDQGHRLDLIMKKGLKNLGQTFSSRRQAATVLSTRLPYVASSYYIGENEGKFPSLQKVLLDRADL